MLGEVLIMILYTRTTLFTVGGVSSLDDSSGRFRESQMMASIAALVAEQRNDEAGLDETESARGSRTGAVEQ